MAKGTPKRLSLAEKRALARPLFLDDSLREPEPQQVPDEILAWAEDVTSETSPKKLISLRVENEVLEFFKAQGPGYQTRMNAVLRAYVRSRKKLRQP